MTRLAAATITAVFAFASTVAATPSASATPKQRIDQLQERVKRLRARTAQLRPQVSRYRQAAATAVLERDRARAETSALQAQLAATPASALPPPAGPSPLDVAAERIRREVAYSERVLQGVGYSHDELIARAAMGYVVGQVSAPAYGWMNEMGGVRPDPTANSVLGNGAGICGHAALTMATIVKRFGLPVRSVQFYYSTGNHIAVEVFYDGDWHYFDPTWGAYYRGTDVLSITEARAHPNPPLHNNETLLWRSVVVQANNSLADLTAMTDSATRVELDQQPFSS